MPYTIGTIFINDALLAYTNEVRQSGNSYVWRINNVDQGTTTDLATAITNCIGTGNREVHILTGGTLSGTIFLRPGLTFYGHNNTFTSGHGGNGFHIEGSGPISMYDFTLNNYGGGMGIRTSRAGDLTFQNITVKGGGIGIRIDSHPSRPYEEGRWVSNVEVINCTFEDNGSHGLETYGVDGFYADGIVARNLGGCGVLLNKTINGTIGTVDAYRCSYGAGYAGLRLANSCSNVVIDMLYANECGRGFFVLSGSNNIQLKNCKITNCVDQWGTGRGIWLENTVNSRVEAGCCDSGVTVTGSGSYANVSTTCNGLEGTYQIRNRGTSLYLDGMGRTTNGADCGQWANTSHVNSQWEVISRDGYYQLRNVGSGLFIDGMGRTSNGSVAGQWANTTHVNSQWSIEVYSGDYVRIQNRGTGLFLDGMGYTTNGSVAGQWANTTHANAQWLLVPILKSASISAENVDVEVSEIAMFPNPVVSSLTIAIPGDYEQVAVQVFDISGKTVLSTVVSGGESELDLSMFTPGIYLVNISGDEWSVNQKIIKK
ncbi:RICIN domain-containing protein [Geofilum rubicundum]|uniref:RICIN domain-containing protein n=1 Tax=Geofilum rubicundum TaxID=472113 RepID=UPI0007849601|nr:RICIN domain-containing protein [Geofilum rubicundum]